MNLHLIEEIGKRALSSHGTLLASYAAVANVIEWDIEGDIVECGVFCGANAAVMAHSLLDHKPAFGPVSKRLHLFDSFEGLPAPGPKDKEFLEAGHVAGLSASTREAVEGHMKEWGVPPALLEYHEGWFVKTVRDFMARTPKPKIALLRLDADLYASTKIAMQLFDLVTPGGIVIVDDYHLTGCREAVNEVIIPGPIYFLKP